MELDERFSKLSKDPSYKKIKKKDKKIKIDSRFEKMFTDERFQTKFTTDKRGKKVDVEEVEDLHSFYDIEHKESGQRDDNNENIEINADIAKTMISDNDEIKAKKKKKKKDITALKKEKNLESGEKVSLGEKKKKKKNKINVLSKEKEYIAEKKENDDVNREEEENEERDEVKKGESSSVSFDDIRGELLPDSSDSENSEFDDLDDVDDVDGDNIVHGWGEIDDDAKYIENAETQRLAVCNCDWDRIGANDLYVLFNSFKPINGTILSVKIYPSDFGIERMNEEKEKGPKELLDSATQDGDEHEEGSQYHMEKVREYQLNRLKYYYAVVECDSKDTANKIYEELDGKEYEMSATRVDLRFIPNDTTFDREPKSVADGSTLLKNYEPINYHNTALQQTTVRLTWDEVDTKRVQATMKKFTPEDIENMDFKDFLASESDEDDDEQGTDIKPVLAIKEPETTDDIGDKEDKKINVYRKLMQEIEAKEKEDKDKKDENIDITFDNNDGDKVSKFNEFSLKNSAIQENDDSSDDESDEDMDDEQDEENDDEMSNNEDIDDNQNEGKEDAGFNDPFFNDTSQIEKSSAKDKSKKKNRKRQRGDSEDELDEDQVKSKKELELLLLDETEDKRHFNLKNIMEQEKMSKSKRKKKKSKDVKENVDNFKIDVSDPRFSALYSSHLYAIDPSEPNFKQTKATEAIIEESQRKRKENKTVLVNPNENKLDTNLSGLLKSIKSKTELHKFKKEKAKLKH